MIGKQGVMVSRYLPKLDEAGLPSRDDSTKPHKYNLIENPEHDSVEQELSSFGIEKFKELLDPLASISRPLNGHGDVEIISDNIQWP